MTDPNSLETTVLARLRERLVYLHNRRWAQLLGIAVLVVLGLWGYFFVRSRLPPTPAQKLEAHHEHLQTYARMQEAVMQLELIRAMIQAGRTPTTIERYCRLLAEELEATFTKAPLELRRQWPDLEGGFRQLQSDLMAGREEALVTLRELEATLRSVRGQ
jgi:hypothetical protein